MSLLLADCLRDLLIGRLKNSELFFAISEESPLKVSPGIQTLSKLSVRFHIIAAYTYMFIVSPSEPTGLVTFTRQSLKSFPKWERYFSNINTNVVCGVK